MNNPVLPGFHPDPSIVRVEDTYYLANSTFEWYPGVELHRSTDMVNWELLPSPLREARLLDMRGNRSSCGIWAPCLSYAEGLFYLVFTNVRSWCDGPWKDTPNYLSTASSIEGPWSDPVFLNASGFDASLFHDDDGRKWLVNMEWDFRQDPDPYKFTGILLQEYSPKKKRLIGTARRIYTGTAIQLTEGPHLYKKNGYYYLLTAEGGTQYGHAVTMARAKAITGPYETHPSNPLLSSYGQPQLYLQKAGHASICETPEGRVYMAYLCGRPLPGTRFCPLGRETAIIELAWKEGWLYPQYNEESKQAAPQSYGRSLPNYPAPSFDPPVQAEGTPYAKPRRYTFEGGPLDGDFKTLRTAAESSAYSQKARQGFLRLRGGESPVSPFKQTLLARRQTDFNFDAETYMEFAPASFQEFAGLCYRYDENNQYLLSVSHHEEKGRVIFVQSMAGGVYSRSEYTALPEGAGIYLGLSARTGSAMFRYALDGTNWLTLRPLLDTAVLSDEFFHEGFTGAFVGMFCVDTAYYRACADFAYFQYTPLAGLVQ
ncbi:MAG: glycoside hydrolase family 43 protein [Treponema sp.]|jgi:xylan 1,4-beta-xylosidase|nr:glycoside hydrolase family 43 protein [Treponema sp.]